MKSIYEMDLVELATYYEDVRKVADEAELKAESVARRLIECMIRAGVIGVVSESNTKWMRDEFDALCREGR